MEFWDIYDKNRVKTGKTIQRGNKLQEGEYHLVVHIWLQNSKGEFLIQKRSENLAWMPGCWATTGGAVISGEESLESAIRETQEELGVSLTKDKFQLLFSQIRKNDISDIWLAYLDIPISAFSISCEDVSEIRWETKENIQNWIELGNFVNYGTEYFSNLGFDLNSRR